MTDRAPRIDRENPDAASKHEPPLFRMLLDKATGIVYVWRGRWTAVTRRA